MTTGPGSEKPSRERGGGHFNWHCTAKCGKGRTAFRPGYRICENWGASRISIGLPAPRQRKGVNVSYAPETPFDHIEGSQEYVALLAESLEEARRDVEAEIALADREGAHRRKEALLLVSYNLAKLHLHITTSRRILNDLRTLRRLLLAQRAGAVQEEEHDASADAHHTAFSGG
jgi:hypothetical protein